MVPGGKEKKGKAKDNVEAYSGKEQVGSPGVRCVLQHKTRIVGERMCRPYAPPWVKVDR